MSNDERVRCEPSPARFDALSREFDALLDKMQTPAARRGMKSAFDASPKALPRAAVTISRKHE